MQASCFSPWPWLIPALPFCHTELRAPKPKPVQYPNEINTLGDHIRTRRLDLKLLQKQVSDHIGVGEITITNWERNATVPAIRYIPAILSFLGYNPIPQAQTLIERFASVRKMLGLSQRKVSELLGLDESTVQGWEAGQHEPNGRNVEMLEQFLRTFGNPAAHSPDLTTPGGERSISGEDAASVEAGCAGCASELIAKIVR